jgi:hypothetical protein
LVWLAWIERLEDGMVLVPLLVEVEVIQVQLWVGDEVGEVLSRRVLVVEPMALRELERPFVGYCSCMDHNHHLGLFVTQGWEVVEQEVEERRLCYFD